MQLPVIHKYVVNPSEEIQELQVPFGSQIVSAGYQNGQIVIWVQNDSPDEPAIYTLRYLVVGTGWPIDSKGYFPVFRGTVIAGPFVWHVFQLEDLPF